MKNYSNLDGLVLCVVGGKIDIKRWIIEIDYLNHLLITYDELSNSIGNLLRGELIYIKNNRVRKSFRGKLISRPSIFGTVNRQLNAQKRIQKLTFDETAPVSFSISKSEFDRAVSEYTSLFKQYLNR